MTLVASSLPSVSRLIISSPVWAISSIPDGPALYRSLMAAILAASLCSAARRHIGKDIEPVLEAAGFQMLGEGRTVRNVEERAALQLKDHVVDGPHAEHEDATNHASEDDAKPHGFTASG